MAQRVGERLERPSWAACVESARVDRRRFFGEVGDIPAVLPRHETTEDRFHEGLSLTTID
jgi:hypothetical protein